MFVTFLISTFLRESPIIYRLFIFVIGSESELSAMRLQPINLVLIIEIFSIKIIPNIVIIFESALEKIYALSYSVFKIVKLEIIASYFHE